MKWVVLGFPFTLQTMPTNVPKGNHEQGWEPGLELGTVPPARAPSLCCTQERLAAWDFGDVGLELGLGRDGTARVKDASVRVPMVACNFLIFNFKYKM